MTKQNELAVVEPPKPEELTRRDSDIAGLCKAIVIKTACEIQGRKYVKVEGWQSIAAAHGCVCGCRDVERVQGGFRAIGELKVIATNQIIATAEGFVGEDEVTWFGGDNGRGKTLPKRPDYAIRAMCQTRAMSRVCRSAFAHVVVLMDAGLSTTPAEEVPDGGFGDAAPPQTPKPAKNAPQSQPEAKERPPKGSFESFVDGDEKREEVMYESFKKVNSKPDAKKAWTAAFCKFSTDSGSTFEAGTFDAAIIAKLEVLQGQPVEIVHRAGRKPNTRELLSIEPQDDVPA